MPTNTVCTQSVYACRPILYALSQSMHADQYCMHSVSLCMATNTVCTQSVYACRPILYALSQSMHADQYCMHSVSLCMPRRLSTPCIHVSHWQHGGAPYLLTFGLHERTSISSQGCFNWEPLSPRTMTKFPFTVITTCRT